MNAEIKEKWVAALRSGEYEQVCGILRQHHSDGHTSYCAMGLLCYQVLDTPELKRAGLSDKSVTDLITMNDEYRMTFDEIADYVEEVL